MNKKILVIFLIFVMSLGLISCSGETTKSAGNRITCVEYFTYDLVREILGDDFSNYDVVLLNTSGKDMHSYEPSAKDILTITDSELVIYLGGISEEWMNEYLDGSDISCLSLIDSFLNMNGVDRYNLDLDDIDEHIYLSTDITSYLVECIDKAISDTFNIDSHTDNVSRIQDELSMMSNIKIGTYPIVVADRFPFEYLSEDLGFNYYAAFDGCSAETEASFSVITELADAIKKYDIKTIFILENSTEDIAKQVIETSNVSDVKIEVIDSLQSVTDLDTSYLDVMESNLNLVLNATWNY